MKTHDGRPIQYWLRVCMNELGTNELVIRRDDPDNHMVGLYVENPTDRQCYSTLPILIPEDEAARLKGLA